MAHAVEPDDAEAFLAYDLHDITESPLNAARVEMSAYIKKHIDRLSIRCDGNCFAHSDGIVTNCYRQFINDTEDDDNG